MKHNGIVLVVSVSIVKKDEILIIKEFKPAAKNKWNFPSGRIEQGEDILVAACREVKEETGFEVKLSHTTGVYNFISDTNHQVILFHFIGEIIGGALKLREQEIIDSKWISIKDLLNIEDIFIRNAEVVKQMTEALLMENIHPITLFKEKLNR